MGPILYKDVPITNKGVVIEAMDIPNFIITSIGNISSPSSKGISLLNKSNSELYDSEDYRYGSYFINTKNDMTSIVTNIDFGFGNLTKYGIPLQGLIYTDNNADGDFDY